MNEKELSTLTVKLKKVRSDYGEAQGRKKALQEQLEDIKKQLKEKYNITPDELSNTIAQLESELAKEYKSLSEKLQELEEQCENA